MSTDPKPSTADAISTFATTMAKAIIRLSGDAEDRGRREVESALLEAKTILNWMVAALKGEEVSDFAQSFPEVRLAMDSFVRATLFEQAEARGREQAEARGRALGLEEGQQRERWWCHLLAEQRMTARGVQGAIAGRGPMLAPTDQFRTEPQRIEQGGLGQGNGPSAGGTAADDGL